MTPEQRRKTMQANKAKNTKPELTFRSALHSRGLRFRIHVKDLPGTPDVVFTRAKVAVFIDGDFWHGYKYRSWKTPLKPFWRDKIVANRARDCRNFKELRALGWKVIRVWEHDVKKALDESVERVVRIYNRQVSNP